MIRSRRDFREFIENEGQNTEGTIVGGATVKSFVFSAISNFMNAVKNKVWARKQKAPILNKILANVMPGFVYDTKQALTIKEYGDIGLVPLSYHGAYTLGDTIMGSYKGVPVRISESNPYYQEVAKTKVRASPYGVSITEEVNLGTIIEFFIDGDPEFTLRVADNAKNEQEYLVTSLKKSVRMEKASLSNAYIDQHYTVKTNDSFKMRKLLEPRHVVKIAKMMDKSQNKISFTFVGGKLVLYIEGTKNIFEGINKDNLDADEIWDDILLLISYLKLYDEFEFNE